MNSAKKEQERIERHWQEFVKKEELTQEQRKQFEKYLALLTIWNEKFNLTTIIKPSSIISYHFQDSLALGHAIDMSQVKGIADAGAGAGFPGIPLKIKYPHLSLVLIEVNTKKIRFLEMLIEELGLFDVMVYGKDWRTFLRKTEFQIDLIVTRASLQLDELFRMFKSSSPYKDGQLVYWASRKWEATTQEKALLTKEYGYKVGSRARKLIFFNAD